MVKNSLDKLPLVIAVTGASGAIYGLTLAGAALENGIPVHLLISDTAGQVVLHETGRSREQWIEILGTKGPLELPDVHDLAASASSGSFPTMGMVIAPCSMGALGRIAAGVSTSLVERCADVCLKERRRLILLTRETPLSLIHIRNMQTVTEAGGIIMPPVPSFYSEPKTITDLVNQTVARVMDLLGSPADNAYRWCGIPGNSGRSSGND